MLIDIKIYKLFFLWILVIGSCTNDKSYSRIFFLEKDAWHKDSVKTFEFSVTESKKEWILVLQNTDLYPYNNIYFFTKWITPKNDTIKDTIQYAMTDYKGRWLGYGIGAIKENILLLIPKDSTLLIGTHKLSVVQAMREDLLIGVHSIGFIIRTSP